MNFELVRINWLPRSTYYQTAKLTKNSEKSQKTFDETGNLDYQGKPNNEISGVFFLRLDFITRVPTNLLDFFPNMTALCINRCKLKKIGRNDLKSYVNLKEINFPNMEIEEIESDLFADLKNLEVIWIGGTKLKFIGKDAFRHLKNLKCVDLRENLSVNFIYADESIKDIRINDNDHVIHNFNEFNETIDRIFHSSPNHLLDIQKILKSDNFKDFTIKIDQNEFRVHKLMLVARSKTFAEMVKNNPEADELILQDIEVKIFEIILAFIYDEKIPEEFDENLTKVFAAADKLKIEGLKNSVGEILSKGINSQNSFEFLKFASKHNDEKLKEKSFGEFKKLFPDRKLKVELMNDIEMLKKLIDGKIAYEKKLRETEEAMRKVKEDFESLLMDAENL
jgi:hypothetical protein